jgi:hypothetical protein
MPVRACNAVFLVHCKAKTVIAKTRKKLRFAQDPAESWQTPYTEKEGAFYFRVYYAGHPFVPRRIKELPPGARETLQALCGILRARHSTLEKQKRSFSLLRTR